MPALSGRKKLRILQDHKQICTVGCPAICINMEPALQQELFTFSMCSPHMSAGGGILPEATNPEKMSPALIAVYCSTHLEALLMPAVQKHDTGIQPPVLSAIVKHSNRIEPYLRARLPDLSLSSRGANHAFTWTPAWQVQDQISKCGCAEQ